MDNKRYAYVREPVDSFALKNYLLIMRNFEETGIDANLNLDLTMYRELEGLNSYVCFSILLGEKVIGYISVVFSSQLHTRIYFAKVDSLYIEPEERSYSAFKSAINFLKKFCFENGCELLYMSSSVKRDLSKLLEKVGFKFCEKLYVMEI